MHSQIYNFSSSLDVSLKRSCISVGRSLKMMNKRLQLSILFMTIFLVISECKVSPELQVTLSHGGGLSGKYMTSLQGLGIRAFLGVPFAEPPVAELRFENPVPKLPWTGFIPVIVDDKLCPQVLGMNFMGDEDCLYLNVFAPLVPKTNTPLPVMVYIHGGGFTFGNGGVPLFTPEYFLDHDVILVSGNYRLDVLGFLSLESEAIPRNVGLKDQSLLLQWVQENILSFGGDPNQVTVFGESAGSASVAYHMLSPMSEKKFQKAILQSGVAHCHWAFDYRGDNSENVKRLGKELNCPLTSDVKSHGNFISCLKSKSAEEILSISNTFRGFNAYSPFLPTVEIEGPNAFISKVPHELTKSHGLNIPILIGTTSHEGIFTPTYANLTESSWNELNERMDITINNFTLATDLSDSRKAEIQKLTKEFYFKSGFFERENIINVTDFFSDGLFVYPNDEFLVNRLVTNDKAAETFVYLYSHRGAASLLHAFSTLLGPEVDIEFAGSAHGDDSLSLFPIIKNMLPHIARTELDGYIQRVMTEYWVNFATTGHPSNSESPVAWNPTHRYPIDYLRIGNFGEPDKELIAMETGLYEDRMKLWRKLKSVVMK